jgi:hypothetical protein
MTWISQLFYILLAQSDSLEQRFNRFNSTGYMWVDFFFDWHCYINQHVIICRWKFLTCFTQIIDSSNYRVGPSTKTLPMTSFCATSPFAGIHLYGTRTANQDRFICSSLHQNVLIISIEILLIRDEVIKIHCYIPI